MPYFLPRSSRCSHSFVRSSLLTIHLHPSPLLLGPTPPTQDGLIDGAGGGNKEQMQIPPYPWVKKATVGRTGFFFFCVRARHWARRRGGTRPTSLNNLSFLPLSASFLSSRQTSKHVRTALTSPPSLLRSKAPPSNIIPSPPLHADLHFYRTSCFSLPPPPSPPLGKRTPPPSLLPPT